MVKADVGTVFKTKRGDELIVLEYRSARDILVQFKDNLSPPFRANIGNLRKGKYKNPFAKSVFNRGFVGVGMYSSKTDAKAYKTWSYMLERAFSDVGNIKRPCQADIVVCGEWLCFQNFAFWFYSQKSSSEANWELDKDLILPYNKVYSPDTCCFLPRELNGRLPKRTAKDARVYLSSEGEFCINTTKLVNGTFKKGHKCFSNHDAAVNAKIENLKNILSFYLEKYDSMLCARAKYAMLKYPERLFKLTNGV